MHDSVAVILLAGGVGSRIGDYQPKQFIKIAGKPVLMHSHDAIRKHMPESLIVVVSPVANLPQVRAMLKHDDKTLVVAGGASRQASALQGMRTLKPYNPKNVLIHDAARPFVSGQIIQDIVHALEKNEAVDVAIPTADTIIIEREGYIESIPKRNHMLRGQTPQAFRYKTLLHCYEEINEGRLDEFTDDCGIFLEGNPSGKVRIVRGHEENIKISNPIDLTLADELMRIRAYEATADTPGISVRGKRILIFGGTSGIGKAVAEVLAEAGASVIARSRSNGCDISNEKDVKNAIFDAAKTLGGIDAVVNAAGLLKKEPISNQASEEITAQINVNLMGAAWVAKWSHAQLKKSKGALLNFASSCFTRGRSDYVIYSATKAAVVNLSQGLAEEWFEDGIRVNCIVPGRTDTEMRRSNFKDEAQDSLGNPYQVALRAAKLLSTEINGALERVL